MLCELDFRGLTAKGEERKGGERRGGDGRPSPDFELATGMKCLVSVICLDFK